MTRKRSLLPVWCTGDALDPDMLCVPELGPHVRPCLWHSPPLMDRAMSEHGKKIVKPPAEIFETSVFCLLILNP